MEEGVDYNSIKYLSKERWFSYWYQFFEVTDQDHVSSVLEIGPGNNIVTNVLRQMGYQVKTADCDETLAPDYIIDIKYLTSSVQEKFDLILCCEMLEHIPFEDLGKTLTDFASLSEKYLIITLPYTSHGTFTPRFFIKVFPFLKPFIWIKKIVLFPKEHSLNRQGGHFWEIGKKGYPLSRIINELEQHSWNVVRHYPLFENPYHYLFVCEKKFSPSISTEIIS